MPEIKQHKFIRILQAILWIGLGIGTMVLLGAAIYKKDNTYCKAVDITIEGEKSNLFIDKADVNRMLEKMNFGKLKAKPLNSFNLDEMEAILNKNEWIKSAELYFDNNDVLRIKIAERTPVARIFCSAGYSFYIDSSGERLPLSNKFSARLPVFTNFPVIVNFSAKRDSILLGDIRNISTYVLQNPFWMAQIEQIDITSQLTFDMIPKVGNQVIAFGCANNYEEKFNNLFIFYKNVLSKVGWNKYAKIDVSYKHQVVAIKRGAGDIKSDSLKTIQLIKILIANAQKQANDSSGNIQLAQPKEDNFIPFAQSRNEDVTDEQPLVDDALSLKKTIDTAVSFPSNIHNTTIASSKMNILNPSAFPVKFKPIEKPHFIQLKKATQKTFIKKPLVVPNKQPKAVMKPVNDY